MLQRSCDLSWRALACCLSAAQRELGCTSSGWLSQLQQGDLGALTHASPCRSSSSASSPAAPGRQWRAYSSSAAGDTPPSSSSAGPSQDEDRRSSQAGTSTRPGPGSAQAQVLPGMLRLLPPAAVPYAQLMRLEKPIGTWLLAWPCTWSIALAAQPGQLPDAKMLALFSMGALLLRGAGCTVNDLWDRDLDKAVERTRTRPLASGAVTPAQAVAFLGLQLSLGLMILLQLNTYSQILGASSLLLVGTYPLFKRFTYWPQAYLGLTINWGAIMGYAAVRGYCDWSVVLPLYFGSMFWSLMYDTIYAYQDKKDDVKAGIKSTALYLGMDSKPWLYGFAACTTAGWLAAGTAADCSWPYHAAVLGAAAHMAWQIRSVDLSNGADCMAKFVSNKWVGALLFAGTVAGRVF